MRTGNIDWKVKKKGKRRGGGNVQATLWQQLFLPSQQTSLLQQHCAPCIKHVCLCAHSCPKAPPPQFSTLPRKWQLSQFRRLLHLHTGTGRRRGSWWREVSSVQHSPMYTTRAVAAEFQNGRVDVRVQPLCKWKRRLEEVGCSDAWFLFALHRCSCRAGPAASRGLGGPH